MYIYAKMKVMIRKYHTEEERKQAHREACRRWGETKRRQYYQDNREKVNERQKQYMTQYRDTPIGRAAYLINGYRRNDKKYNRGECTLTAQWIVENIFNQPCHYCGESDWRKLGCDRLDNTKPHTPDNVVCCCSECNLKKQKSSYEEFMKKIGRP